MQARWRSQSDFKVSVLNSVSAIAPTMSFSSNGAPFIVKDNMIPVTIAQIGPNLTNTGTTLKNVASNSISIGVRTSEPEVLGHVTQKIEPKMEPLLKHRFNPAFDASLVNISAAKAELSVALKSFAEKFNIDMDFGSSTEFLNIIRTLLQVNYPNTLSNSGLDWKQGIRLASFKQTLA